MPNWYHITEAANDDTRISSAHVGPSQEFVCDSCMFEKYAPPIPVARLLGRSGVCDAVESFNTAASDDIQEEMFLDRFLMWHYAAV